MSHARRGLMVTLVALLALAGSTVSATYAGAMPPPPDPYDHEPPCEWEAGGWHTDSGCDGLDTTFPSRHWDYCEASRLTADVANVVGPGGRILAQIVLVYHRGERTTAYPGGICRTIRAKITVFHPRAFGCYVKVERNSDGQAYRASNVYRPVGNGGVFTAALYDAGVTSYAWGYCKYQFASGAVDDYSAQTRSY